MREILFRAKRIDDGKWIDGDLTRCVVVGETHIRRIEENLSTTTHRVDPETVCQYTGLTDKNGRKIFEGDIIKYNMSNGIGMVEWYHGAYTGWYVDDTRMGEQQFTNEMWNKCEVIGNIFDNPDFRKI